MIYYPVNDRQDHLIVNMRGVKRKQNTCYKVKMEFVLFKVIARRVNIFIPLGDETINSSLVERGTSLMDPQPHQLTHSWIFSSEWNRRDVHECLSSGRQKCERHKGKDVDCTEDVEVLPSQISEAYPSTYWQYRDGRYHAKGRFRPTEFQGVLTLLRVPAHSTTKKRTTPLYSYLVTPLPKLEEQTLHYAHLHSNK